MDFPEEWDINEIEFYLNDSSYCCDNLISSLREYSKKHGCTCNITECKVIDNN